MQIALAGKPGCGRSTLFRALAGNSGADTGKPLTVDVPDHRLDHLALVHEPEKNTHARVVFSDIPSPCFAPRNLGRLRNAAVIVAVLDNYALGSMLEDFQEMESEMILADMSLCENRLARLTKESRAGSREAVLMKGMMEWMEEGRPLRTMEMDAGARDIISPYSLLSRKPLIAVSNRADPPISPEDDLEVELSDHGGELLKVDAGFELELAEIDPAERQPFLESMGYSASGLSRLIRSAYSALELIVFFTIGKDETRAWPVSRGSTALDAAGTIHSDLARGFIRAVVIPWELFHEHPDRNYLKENGLLQLEGKDYRVKDGDILEIRFNV